MTPATSRFFPLKSGVKPVRPGSAFTLIEVMVSVTLMSIIVLGLLAMFSQTQRAFRSGITQVDVMEGGRAACEMMAREMELTTPTHLPNTLNFFAQWDGYVLIQSLPGTDTSSGELQYRTNVLDNIFFLTRDNRNWQGIGYRVESTNMVGTLYRYETNVANLNLAGIAAQDQVSSSFKFRDMTFITPRSRVVDGVVHLRVLAYDSSGALITPAMPYVVPFGVNDWVGVTNRILRGNILQPPAHDLNLEYHFRDQAVPAYLELEIGILESKTAERCRNLPLTAQVEYLRTKAGNVQIFRQRIPVRNVQPSVYQ